MSSQVKKLEAMGIIDTSFIALDSTPVNANTKLNNPKSFAKNKFSKDNQPKSDIDCGLGVHTASNQHNERNFEYECYVKLCITFIMISFSKCTVHI